MDRGPFRSTLRTRHPWQLRQDGNTRISLRAPSPDQLPVEVHFEYLFSATFDWLITSQPVSFGKFEVAVFIHKILLIEI
jgi:hypothetical protein